MVRTSEYVKLRVLALFRLNFKVSQCVREPNRVARLAFAERCLEAGETFDDVVFTDESSIWLERHNKVCFRKKGMPVKLKPTVKHPYKVHVWGGISKRGATSILIFTGIMKKEFYVEAILRPEKLRPSGVSKNKTYLHKIFSSPTICTPAL